MHQVLFFLHHVNVHLRDYVFYFSCATSLIVFIFLIILFLTFKKQKLNLGVDVVWAVIPFIMLFVIMIPVVNMFLYQQPDKPSIMITDLQDESAQ